MAREEFEDESSGAPSSVVSTATKEMVAYCFEVLCAKLEGRSPPKPHPSIPSNKRFPLFVTWKKSADMRLRGCIGTFSEMQLPSGIAEYALTSALRDSRFDPVVPSELPSLSCSVSLLVQFEPAKDYMDWQIGVHGIRIHFVDPATNKQRDAVFLPEVMPEQGWDHLATINQLIKKAGYRGEVPESLRRACRVTRFQSAKARMGYDEWRRDFSRK